MCAENINDLNSYSWRETYTFKEPTSNHFKDFLCLEIIFIILEVVKELSFNLWQLKIVQQTSEPELCQASPPLLDKHSLW